jgi:hypothetical protein
MSSYLEQSTEKHIYRVQDWLMMAIVEAQEAAATKNWGTALICLGTTVHVANATIASMEGISTARAAYWRTLIKMAKRTAEAVTQLISKLRATSSEVPDLKQLVQDVSELQSLTAQFFLDDFEIIP